MRHKKSAPAGQTKAGHGSGDRGNTRSTVPAEHDAEERAEDQIETGVARGDRAEKKGGAMKKIEKNGAAQSVQPKDKAMNRNAKNGTQERPKGGAAKKVEKNGAREQPTGKRGGTEKKDDAAYAHNPRYSMIVPDAADPDPAHITSTGES